jgi:hypothetical protein
LSRIEQGCFASSWNVQNTLSDPGSRVFSCNAAQKPSTVTDTGRRCASRLFRDSELVLANEVS